LNQFVRHRPKQASDQTSEISQRLILGIDPGNTCGIAAREPMGWWTIGQVTTLSALWDVLQRTTPEIIVCERFTPQPRQKIVATAIEFIGVAKLYSELNDVPFEPQTPSQAKNFVGDRLLRHSDLWIKGMQHGRDAIRHVLYYQIKHGESSYIEHLKPQGETH
jgi:predicted RNase H-like nuclease (RuvC/YqgF family)